MEKNHIFAYSTEIKDLEYENAIIRTYSKDVENDRLKWESEEFDSFMDPLYESGWNILFKEMLPQKLNQRFFVKKNESYKLIKGKCDFSVRIIRI